MLVVADASPVNILVRIEQIGVLPRLFEQVIVPPAVVRELTHAKTPEMVRQWMGSAPTWLQMRTPKVIDATTNVHLGEREAIALAKELRAEFLLVDDRKARLAARALGLRIAGTVAVLERAASRGLLDLREAVVRLRSTDFSVVRVDPGRCSATRRTAPPC
jgi:predicted nucleic acid-binding protein